MQGFDPRTSFGPDESMRYDAEDTRGDEDQTVAFLARLAGQQEALELAVGTGRIALPMMGAGVPVDGIELSRHMVDRMREKPGGDEVMVTMGDMARASTGRTYCRRSGWWRALPLSSTRSVQALPVTRPGRSLRAAR